MLQAVYEDVPSSAMTFTVMNTKLRTMVHHEIGRLRAAPKHAHAG